MPAGFSVGLRNARADAITTFVGNAGILEIYSGTRPALGGAETTLLASFTLGTPFDAAASAGGLTPTLPASVNASATGTATWARIYQADGTTHVMDLGVGVAGSGQEIIMNSVALTAGVACTITGFTITEGNAT